MPADLSIDRGAPADLEACVGLWLVALEARDGFAPSDGTADRCRGKFELPIVSWRVLRGDDGEVQGFGLVTGPGTGRPQDPADAAYLSLLAVAPAAQGSGRGSALLNALLGDARAAGHPAAVLHALPDNTAAMRLYLSRGWTPVGEEFAHPLFGRPTVTLAITLR
ncbi:hypothetical protein AX769_10430 [Frondihabitans sp. PAMC 28766]|nr:hypothetical protein AX769_10430 [Frondihabitans sp. PAMC 28766]